MTPDEHASAIRVAVEALNTALALAARDGVGVLIDVRLTANSDPAVTQRVSAVPYLKLTGGAAMGTDEAPTDPACLPSSTFLRARLAWAAVRRSRRARLRQSRPADHDAAPVLSTNPGPSGQCRGSDVQATTSAATVPTPADNDPIMAGRLG